MKKIGTTILIAFIVSFSLGLFFIQNSSSFLFFIQKKIETFFSKTFACATQVDVMRLSLAQPFLEAGQVWVGDECTAHPTWFWSVQEAQIQSSWITGWLSKKLPLYINFKGIDVFSSYDQTLAIENHIKKLFFDAAEAPPVLLEKLNLDTIRICIADKHNAWQLLSNARADVCINPQKTMGTINFADFTLLDKQKNCLLSEGCMECLLQPRQQKTVLSLAGSIRCSYWQGSPKISLKGIFDSSDLRMNAYLEPFPDDVCTVRYVPTTQECFISGSFAVEHFNKQYLPFHCTGKVSVEGAMQIKNGNVDARIISDEVLSGPLKIQKIKITIKKNQAEIHINGSCNINEYGPITIEGSVNEHGTGIIWIRSKSHGTLAYGNKSINHEQSALMLCVKNYAVDHAELTTNLCYLKNKKTAQLHITQKNSEKYDFKFCCDALKANGTIEKKLLNHLSVQWNEKKLCALELHDDGYQSTFSLDTINTCLTMLGISVPMHGALKFFVPFDRTHECRLDVEKGTIYLPIHNFIKSVKGVIDYDMTEKYLSIHNGVVQFHNGQIIVDACQLSWSDGFSMLSKMRFKDLLVNYQQLICFLNGSVIYQRDAHNKHALSGSVSIDKAHYKKNIFAEVLRYALHRRSLSHTLPSLKSPFACDLDLYIYNQSPIIIGTSFIDVKIGNDIHRAT